MKMNIQRLNLPRLLFIEDSKIWIDIIWLNGVFFFGSFQKMNNKNEII